jgi:ABC-2 type transport system permease protein
VSALPVLGAIAGATFRALLGRRRTLLMTLLAAVPVVIGLLYRVAGEGTIDAPEVLDLLVVRTVMPLTTLVFGTAALGAELEDGTGIALLTKPIPRWQIVAAKVAVAALLSAVAVAVSGVATALLLGIDDGSVVVAYVVAIAIGSLAYATAFVTLSVITSRALVVGLAYTLLWEGWLAGILPGTQNLSLREATLGLVSLVAPSVGDRSALDATGSVLLIGVVVVAGLVLGTERLGRYQVKGGD